MDKAAFANFIRHLLFLFIFLKMVTSIILNFQVRDCSNQYVNHEMIPISLEKSVIHAIQITLDFVFIFISCCSFLTIIVSCVGLYGAITLYSHSLVNCAAGGAFLVVAFQELVTAQALGNLIFSFEFLIKRQLKSLFFSSNQFVQVTSAGNGDAGGFVIGLLYDMYPPVQGWNPLNTGGPLNHCFIDYVHSTMKCCGYSGRMFWEASAPTSCCSSNLADENCTLALGFNKRCRSNYLNFRGCLSTLKVEMVFFGLISVATALSAIYLAYLGVKYSDGKIMDETSSDEEDEEIL